VRVASHQIEVISTHRKIGHSPSITREIGHVNTENPWPLHWSKFPIFSSRKDHWVHIPDPGTYPLVDNPIVNGAFLPKTLSDGGNSLNIIFTETLRKMELDFNKMTACDEPFYGVVPGKAAYPIGCVCLPFTFGTEENFRIEYLTFEVADFRSSYHAILGRPMLAKFMAIPHHTYLIMKMPVPNGILSVLGDIMVSYNCESASVELSKGLAIKAATTVMVAQAAKIDQTTLQVPETKRTSTTFWTQVQLSRRFASACPTHPWKLSSGPTSTPNRNSCSQVSLGTTLTFSHGVHLICLVSPRS
jgi:hypothetical protein